MSELDRLLADIRSSEAARATKRQWNPERQGEIDIRIAADGNWFHQGRRFQRASLVKLFASVLRREQDGYFLVTPKEKLRIQVEDAPFTAGLVETFDDNGRQAVVLTTNLGERVVVDREHPIRVEVDTASGQPRPYLSLYGGLEALINRSAFFDLLNLADQQLRDGKGHLVISSMDHEFDLGCSDE